MKLKIAGILVILSLAACAGIRPRVAEECAKEQQYYETAKEALETAHSTAQTVCKIQAAPEE